MTVTQPLPRRLRLGVQLAKVPFRDGGLVVAAVLPGSFAAGVGLLPGDVVTAIAGHPTADATQLRAALRGAAGASIEVDVLRGGATRRASAPAVRVADEVVAAGSIHYATLARPGARLRVIATIPKGDGPHPVIVFLQGIACASLDFGGAPLTTIGALLHELTRRGIATVRLERRGLGDSEGGPCEALDFQTEVDDLRALVVPAMLATIPRIDVERVALFGHSIGGMMLPLVAPSASPRAAIVAGSSRRRWSECMAASTRRQIALRGGSPEDVEAAVSAETEAIVRAAPDDELFGRSGAFHGQLQNANIGDAFDRLTCPLLVVQGEYDWVVAEDEAQRFVAARPGVEVVVPSKMDHSFGVHASLEESLAAYGKGTFDPAVANAIVEFLARHGIAPRTP